MTTGMLDRSRREASRLGDTFAGAAGETRARDYQVFGHTFRAVKQ